MMAPPSHVEVELPPGAALVTLRVAQVAFVSEANCETVTGVAPRQWARTLTRWGVPFVKSGRVHTARMAEIEAAIGRLEKRPAPTSKVEKAISKGNGPRSVNEQAKAVLARVRGVA